MAYCIHWVVVLLLLFMPAGQPLFRRLRDPLRLFCGKDDCYEVLNVTRNSTKDEIRQSYRALSRVHHPDKGGDAQNFAIISRAYDVFMNDTKREEYNYYILDYPDAYSGKYGRRVLYSNSPKSDPILVLVGIFMFVSVIVVAFQYNRHSNAVSFICIAAEASLPPNRGGWPVSSLIRKRAEERIMRRSPVNDTKQSTKGSKPGRKGKQKKSTEVSAELHFAIRECAEEIELLGEFAAVSWSHVPILQCYKWPFQIARYASYFSRWATWRLFGGGRKNAEMKSPLSDEDNEHWICCLIGREIWETISTEMRKEAIAFQVWRDEETMDRWKGKVGLTGNGIIRMKPEGKSKSV